MLLLSVCVCVCACSILLKKFRSSWHGWWWMSILISPEPFINILSSFFFFHFSTPRLHSLSSFVFYCSPPLPPSLAIIFLSSCSLHCLWTFFFHLKSFPLVWAEPGWNRRSQVAFCRERLDLSGCVWRGCSAVRNHGSRKWRFRPLCLDWCVLSASPLRRRPRRCWVDVCPLTPFDLLNAHMYVRWTRVHTRSEVLQRPSEMSCVPSLCVLSDTWITWVGHAIRGWV